MKIIKVSTELEMSVHEFPFGTIREHNKALCELIGNGCDLVEHVMPKRLLSIKLNREKRMKKLHMLRGACSFGYIMQL